MDIDIGEFIRELPCLLSQYVSPSELWQVLILLWNILPTHPCWQFTQISQVSAKMSRFYREFSDPLCCYYLCFFNPITICYNSLLIYVPPAQNAVYIFVEKHTDKHAIGNQKMFLDCPVLNE